MVIPPISSTLEDFTIAELPEFNSKCVIRNSELNEIFINHSD